MKSHTCGDLPPAPAVESRHAPEELAPGVESRADAYRCPGRAGPSGVASRAGQPRRRAFTWGLAYVANARRGPPRRGADPATARFELRERRGAPRKARRGRVRGDHPPAVAARLPVTSSPLAGRPGCTGSFRRHADSDTLPRDLRGRRRELRGAAPTRIRKPVPRGARSAAYGEGGGHGRPAARRRKSRRRRPGPPTAVVWTVVTWSVRDGGPSCAASASCSRRPGHRAVGSGRISATSYGPPQRDDGPLGISTQQGTRSTGRLASTSTGRGPRPTDPARTHIRGASSTAAVT